MGGWVVTQIFGPSPLIHKSNFLYSPQLQSHSAQLVCTFPGSLQLGITTSTELTSQTFQPSHCYHMNFAYTAKENPLVSRKYCISVPCGRFSIGIQVRIRTTATVMPSNACQSCKERRLFHAIWEGTMSASLHLKRKKYVIKRTKNFS